jgi:hypothetical protein
MNFYLEIEGLLGLILDITHRRGFIVNQEIYEAEREKGY